MSIYVAKPAMYSSVNDLSGELSFGPALKGAALTQFGDCTVSLFQNYWSFVDGQPALHWNPVLVVTFVAVNKTSRMLKRTIARYGLPGINMLSWTGSAVLLNNGMCYVFSAVVAVSLFGLAWWVSVLVNCSYLSREFHYRKLSISVEVL